MKRIDELTKEQIARFGEWKNKWIEIGLKTGKADWDTFEKAAADCYRAAGMKAPLSFVRVESPLVLALAAPTAAWILDKKKGAVIDTVHDAVHRAVHNAVRGAVSDAVHRAVHDEVKGEVEEAVNHAVNDAVGDAVHDSVNVAVYDAVNDAVNGAVNGAVRHTVGDAVREAINGSVRDVVEKAVDVAVNLAVHDAVGDAVYRSVGKAVNGAVKDQVNGAVNLAVDVAVNLAVHDAVGDAVGDAVRDSARVVVLAAVGIAVAGAVRGAVSDAVHRAVSDSVDVAVNLAVHGAVGNAVDVAVHDEVQTAVHGAVDVAVSGAVNKAVEGAVSRDVDQAVYGAVSGAVRKAIRENPSEVKYAIQNNWHKYLGGQFWVGGWYWGSPAYVSFFTDVCELELDPEIQKRAEAYRKTAESATWWWPHKDFCMVCDRPKILKRDSTGKLHSLDGPAIAWPNFELYYIHGVSFDAEMYAKITSGSMAFKEIIALENIEHRMIALKLMDAVTLLKDAKAKLLNKSKSGNELYLIKNLFSSPAYFLKYQCPSTARVYVSGVPPEIGIEADADQAMAWKFRLKVNEYKSITAQS